MPAARSRPTKFVNVPRPARRRSRTASEGATKRVRGLVSSVRANLLVRNRSALAMRSARSAWRSARRLLDAIWRWPRTAGARPCGSAPGSCDWPEAVGARHAVLDQIGPISARLLTLGEPCLRLLAILADLLTFGHAGLSLLPVRPHLLALSHAGLGLVARLLSLDHSTLRLLTWLLALGTHLDVLLALSAHLHGL